MLTIFTSKYSAIWYSQAKGFSVKQHTGWCIGGLHIEGGGEIQTLQDTIKHYKAIKAKIARKQAKEEAKLNKLITIDDSIKVGNCLSGTLSFKNRYFPNREAVTIREVLEKEDSVFTRRLLSIV